MLVREGARSGSYISIMDDANDMLIGMSDMDVLGAVSPEHIRRMAEKINACGICVTDANLEPRTLEALCDAAGVPVFLDTVSGVKAQRLRGIIGRFDTIKPNRMELVGADGYPGRHRGGPAQRLRGAAAKGRAAAVCLAWGRRASLPGRRGACYPKGKPPVSHGERHRRG